MLLRRLLRKGKPLCLLLAALVGGQGVGLAQECGPGGCQGGAVLGAPCGSPHCHRQDCPPPYTHCMEGPPKIKFKKGCPRPVCPPACETPNWGYFQPCWRPWPWPPDWSHCPYPVPAAVVTPPPPGMVPLAIEGPAPGSQQLHQPRRLESNPGPQEPGPGL